MILMKLVIMNMMAIGLSGWVKIPTKQAIKAGLFTV